MKLIICNNFIKSLVLCGAETSRWTERKKTRLYAALEHNVFRKYVEKISNIKLKSERNNKVKQLQNRYNNAN